MFKFQDNGLLYCEFCKKVSKTEDKILQNETTQTDYLQKINANLEKLLKKNIQSQKENTKKNIVRERDEKGRFVSKNKQTETEKPKTAREQAEEVKSSGKEKINLQIPEVDLEKPLEATGEAYYKAFEEIKSNILDPLKNGFVAIKGFFKEDNDETTKTSVLQRYKQLLNKKANAENTNEYRAFTKETERENLKQNEEQTKLLDDIKKKEGTSHRLFNSLFGSLFGFLKPLKKVLFKILKIFPLMIGTLTAVYKLLPDFIKSKLKLNKLLKKETVKTTEKISEKATKKEIEKSIEKTAEKETVKTTEKIGAKETGKVAEKEVVKGVEKTAGKSFLKKIPFLGALFGLAFAFDRMREGDTKGAGLELLSGVLSSVPVIGTAGSVAIDAYLMKRDFDKAYGTDVVKTGIMNLTGEKPNINQAVYTYDTKQTKPISAKPVWSDYVINDNVTPKPFENKDSKQILKLLTEQKNLLERIADKDIKVEPINDNLGKMITDGFRNIKINTESKQTVIYNPDRQYLKGVK